MKHSTSRMLASIKTALFNNQESVTPYDLCRAENCVKSQKIFATLSNQVRSHGHLVKSNLNHACKMLERHP